MTMAAIAAGLVSCDFDRVYASGRITSETVNVGPFDEIEASRGVQVYLDASARPDRTIEIKADDNLHRYILAYVEDRTLVLKVEDHILLSGGTIKVYIDNDDIRSLDGSGGARFSCSGEFTERDLEIELSGGSRFEGTVDVDELDVELSGGSKAEIEGSCGKFTLESSGGSNLGGYSLRVDDSILDISGGSRVEQTILGTLRADASGGSSVRYKGTPEILSLNVSGGSTVRRE